jgi:hypothetical protein
MFISGKAFWNTLKLRFEQFNVRFYWFLTPFLQYLVLEFADTWPWMSLKSPWIWLFLTCTNPGKQGCCQAVIRMCSHSLFPVLCNMFLYGDKTYNTFCLWKHHVNLLLQNIRSVINLRGVSTDKKYNLFPVVVTSMEQVVITLFTRLTTVTDFLQVVPTTLNHWYRLCSWQVATVYERVVIYLLTTCCVQTSDCDLNSD